MDSDIRLEKAAQNDGSAALGKTWFGGFDLVTSPPTRPHPVDQITAGRFATRTGLIDSGARLAAIDSGEVS